MRRFRNFRRGMRGGNRLHKPRWLGQTGGVSLAANSQGAVNLISGASMNLGNANAESELVVHRLVGTVKAIPNDALAGTMGFGILRAGTGTTAIVGGANDPLTGNALGISDWLWFHNFDWQPNSVANSIFDQRDFDIRVRRRLETNDSLIAIFVNPAGGGALIGTIDVRILIKLRT